MNSFRHLAAACCIAAPNPKARLREQEVFRQVTTDTAKYAKIISKGRTRHRWGATGKGEVPPTAGSL